MKIPDVQDPPPASAGRASIGRHIVTVRAPHRPAPSAETRSGRSRFEFREVAAVLSLIVGSMVLIGWTFDIAGLKRIVPGWVLMKPNTALAFVFLGFALGVVGRVAMPLALRLMRGCALVAGLIGLLTLAEYVFGWNPGFDQWLFREPPGAAATSHAGRMAPDTALCFVLLSAALVLGGGRARWRSSAAVILGLLVSAVALAAILASFTPVLRLQGWWGLTIMAPPTAMLFGILAAALILQDWPKLAVRRRWFLVFAGLTLLLVAAGGWYYRAEAERLQLAKHEEIAAIGELKSSQIEQWREGRMRDAVRMVRVSTMRNTVAQFLREPAEPILVALWERLLVEREVGGYANALLFAPDGTLLLATNETSGSANPATQRVVAAALTSRGAILSDFFRQSDGAIQIDVAATVRDLAGEPLAVVVLRSDAAAYLYPLIQKWPTPSRSAETFIVQRDGDELVFLNDARHRPGTALTQRNSRNETNLPSVQAVFFGRQGVFEGVDYRGVPVLADVRPIAGSPWFMVAKVDVEEVFAEVRSGTAMIALVVGTLILLGAVATGSIYRQQNASAISRLNAYNRSLLEASLDPLVSISPEGKITDVNAASAEVTGLSREQLVGRDFSDFFTEPEQARAVCRQVFAQGFVKDCSLAIRHTTGRITSVLYNASVYRDEQGQVIGVFGAARDITELRRSEAALKESEEAFRTLAEAMPQIVWATRPDGWNIYFNRQWADYTGMPLEESYGHGWNIPFHPDDQKRSWDAWQQATQHGATYSLEVRLRRKDGVYRWWLVRGAPLQDADGKILKWFGTCTDIHDLKQAEEKIRRLNAGLEQRVEERTQDLAESEARLRAVLRATATGTFEIDLQTGEGRWNEVEYELLGLKPGEAPPGPATFFRHVHPDDARTLGAQWEEAKRNGTLDAEFRVVRADGEVRWLAGKGHFAYAHRAGGDSSLPWGQPERFLGVNYDITGRKLAEQTLQQNRQDLDRAQQVGQIGSWRLDVRRNLLTWSDENHRIFGVPLGTPLTYESFLNIVHPDDRVNVDARWKASLAGEPYDLEHRLLVHGGVKWVREKAFLEFDPGGELLGGFGITQDITERKQAEQALRESEQRLAIAVQAAREGVWHWDMASGKLIWSPQLFRMFGLDPDAAEPTFDVWRSLTHPADRAAAEAKIDAAIKNHAHLENEYRVVLPSGAVRWISALGATAYAENGQPLSMAGVCLDITDRKQAELELRQLTAELKEANQELESFAYSVSHDLRAPLRGIDGWSRALVEDYGDKLDGRAHEYLARVCGEAQRMGHLIDDMLQLSQVARAEIRRDPVDLGTMAKEIVADLWQHDAQRSVEFVVAPALIGFGDARLLRLVLENLLGNAWKFTAKTPRARIEFGCETTAPGSARPAGPVFFVRDNGAGFDMAHAARLFAPFQRLHRPSEFPGTGIGLATVRRIILRHGGRVWAEAVRDRGATFFFTLQDNAVQ